MAVITYKFERKLPFMRKKPMRAFTIEKKAIIYFTKEHDMAVGLLHRDTDLPAYIGILGMSWYKNANLHRAIGPAKKFGFKHQYVEEDWLYGKQTDHKDNL